MPSGSDPYTIWPSIMSQMEGKDFLWMAIQRIEAKTFAWYFLQTLRFKRLTATEFGDAPQSFQLVVIIVQESI